MAEKHTHGYTYIESRFKMMMQLAFSLADVFVPTTFSLNFTPTAGISDECCWCQPVEGRLPAIHQRRQERKVLYA